MACCVNIECTSTKGLVVHYCIGAELASTSQRSSKDDGKFHLTRLTPCATACAISRIQNRCLTTEMCLPISKDARTGIQSSTSKGPRNCGTSLANGENWRFWGGISSWQGRLGLIGPQMLLCQVIQSSISSSSLSLVIDSKMFLENILPGLEGNSFPPLFSVCVWTLSSQWLFHWIPALLSIHWATFFHDCF